VPERDQENPKRLSFGYTFLASPGATHFSPWQEADTIKATIGAFFLTTAGA